VTTTLDLRKGRCFIDLQNSHKLCEFYGGGLGVEYPVAVVSRAGATTCLKSGNVGQIKAVAAVKISPFRGKTLIQDRVLKSSARTDL
jgi:hypothetical protein